MIYGTSIFDQYSGSTLPGVEEALIRVAKFGETSVEQWNEVRHQLGIVTSVIHAAAKILTDVNTW